VREKELPTPENIAARRREFSELSENELIERREKFLEGSASSIVATQFLAEIERRRFHWIFWPALAAAIASVLALALQVSQLATQPPSAPLPAQQQPASPSQMPANQ
jgi:hypothetical protein